MGRSPHGSLTTLEAAYEEADLYDEVHNENIKRKGSYFRDSHQEESSSSSTFNKLSPKKIIPQDSRSNLKKEIKEDPVDEITTRMKNLRIKHAIFAVRKVTYNMTALDSRE